MIFLQKNDLNIEKIKVKFPQIYLTLISTLKEENKIVLTKMAPGQGIRVNGQDPFTKSGGHARSLRPEVWNFAWDLVWPIRTPVAFIVGSFD